MKELEWSQHYSLIFQMLKGSQLQNKNIWWDLDEIQTHPSFNSCPYCMQEWRRSIQNWKHQSGYNISPIISL